jgi:hypothetical protein
MAMSTDQRTVDIRAGPATCGGQPVFGEIQTDDEPEPRAANQRTLDPIEGLPRQAGVPSAIDAGDNIVPNSWFG